MLLRSLMKSVLSLAIIGGVLVMSAGVATAGHRHHQHPSNVGHNWGNGFNPGFVPVKPFIPPYIPPYNPGFNVPLPGGGIDRVRFTPNGIVQDIITPGGRIDIYNGYNGQGFEVIQPNGGFPVFLPF